MLEIILQTSFWGCVLCHQYHPVQFHSYPERKVRSPEKGENTKIRIPVIECPNEKAAKRQYTKRMLPAFLTPFCVIRQDLALEAFIKFEDHESLTSEVKEKIALILGCIDLRSVAKHMQAIAEKLHSIQNEIYCVLSFHYSPLPYLQPDASSSNTTLTLIRQLKECYCTIGGRIIPEHFFTILQLLSYLDHYKHFSMTYASRRPAFWDTS